jgi:hypothetical protein
LAGLSRLTATRPERPFSDAFIRPEDGHAVTIPKVTRRIFEPGRPLVIPSTLFTRNKSLEKTHGS